MERDRGQEGHLDAGDPGRDQTSRMAHLRAVAERFRRIEGDFFRCVLADRVDDLLKPPAPSSAGRYHRHGQPVLYLSPKIEWAMIAISGYMREDRKARVVIPVSVSAALVFDQYDDEACRLLCIDRERSNAKWRNALANGRNRRLGKMPTRLGMPAPKAL